MLATKTGKRTLRALPLEWLAVHLSESAIANSLEDDSSPLIAQKTVAHAFSHSSVLVPAEQMWPPDLCNMQEY
jgi:hypothetical protein